MYYGYILTNGVGYIIFRGFYIVIVVWEWVDFLWGFTYIIKLVVNMTMNGKALTA